MSQKPGLISFRTETEYERAVLWTLSYMVEPTANKQKRERQPLSRLFVEVKSYFAMMGWLAGLGHGIRDHRVVPRYTLSSEEGVGVDFALLNSSMHYMQTADLRTVSNGTQKRQEVQSKLFALGLAEALTPADLLGNGIERYSVIAGSDTEEGRRAIKAAQRISRVFVHESNDDMDDLMGIFAKAMQQEPLPNPDKLQ